MVETMVDAEGLGLAAPQVHVPRRVVVFHTPRLGEEGSEDDWSGLTVLINPTIEPLGDEREEGWEGRLSVPGLHGLVPRFARVRYRGITPGGKAIDRTVEGLHVRVVPHACGHLDSVLFPMRMTDLSTLIFESELRHVDAAAKARRTA